MDKDGGKLTDGPLKQALEEAFGSVEAFKRKFNATTAAIQGSGWGWLVSAHACIRRVLMRGFHRD